MRLPVAPPILPMLAKRVSALPSGTGWIFEPKWDGFRVVVFRDGELLLQSCDEKPLDRCFPELREPLLAQLPARLALDGELVVVKGGALRGAPAAHPSRGVPDRGRLRDAGSHAAPASRSCAR